MGHGLPDVDDDLEDAEEEADEGWWFHGWNNFLGADWWPVDWNSWR